MRHSTYKASNGLKLIVLPQAIIKPKSLRWKAMIFTTLPHNNLAVSFLETLIKSETSSLKLYTIRNDSKYAYWNWWRLYKNVSTPQEMITLTARWKGCKSSHYLASFRKFCTCNSPDLYTLLNFFNVLLFRWKWIIFSSETAKRNTLCCLCHSILCLYTQSNCLGQLFYRFVFDFVLSI